jgi:hypothetical protein
MVSSEYQRRVTVGMSARSSVFVLRLRGDITDCTNIEQTKADERELIPTVLLSFQLVRDVGNGLSGDENESGHV